jgi:hypothetical protein
LLSQVIRRGDDSRYEFVFSDRLLKNGREVADELGGLRHRRRGDGARKLHDGDQVARGQVTAQFANSPPPAG